MFSIWAGVWSVLTICVIHLQHKNTPGTQEQESNTTESLASLYETITERAAHFNPCPDVTLLNSYCQIPPHSKCVNHVIKTNTRFSLKFFFVEDLSSLSWILEFLFIQCRDWQGRVTISLSEWADTLRTLSQGLLWRNPARLHWSFH